jgi:hypothetical protein
MNNHQFSEAVMMLLEDDTAYYRASTKDLNVMSVTMQVIVGRIEDEFVRRKRPVLKAVRK